MSQSDVPTTGPTPPAKPVELDRTGAYTPGPSTLPLTAQLDTVPVTKEPVELVEGYEFLGQLGRGGMGVVYHARETGLNRSVALKMVLGADRADRKALIRFLAEAEAIAAIDHPNVVRVYRYGESDGRPFMALEYLPGGTLASKLRGGVTIPAAEAVDLMRQVARGVAAAHHLGIVHRDLKPGNVLLTADGEPKVADFGLARRGESDLTQTGAVMGTPAYMSPEQAKGETKFVGPATDVWALGVILYQCLTGQQPFTGEDTWSIIQTVLSHDPVRPRTLDPRVPRDLELVCMKCLSKDARERYPTAAELADELDRFAAGKPVTVRAAGTGERIVKWAKRNPTLAGLYASVVAATLLFAFGGVVAWLWRSEAAAHDLAVTETGRANEAKAAAELAQTAAEQAKASEATAHAETQQSRADLAKLHDELAAQDVLRKVDLAHQAVLDDNALRAVRLLNGIPSERRQWEWRYVARLAQPETRRFQADGGLISNVAVSKDEQRVYASCPEGVRVWNPNTGEEHTGYRGHTTAVRHIVLHPDGKRAISAASDGKVHIWEIKTGKRLTEVTVEPAAEILRLAVSEDGTRLAVGSMSGRITIWNPDTGQQVIELKGQQGPVLCLLFLPDGRLLSGGFDRMLHVWDVEKGKEASKPVYLRGMLWAIAVSPGGKTVWMGDESGRVSAIPLARLNEEPAAAKVDPKAPLVTPTQTFQAHPSRVWAISFNQDGSRLLTAGMDRTAMLWAIQGTTVTERPVKTLRGHYSDVVDAAFLRTGNRVVTCADSTVRVFDDRSATDSRVLATSPGLGFRGPGELAFSNDRTLLVLVDGRLQSFDVDTGMLGPLTLTDQAPVTAVAVSPDGRSIAEGYSLRVRVRPLVEVGEASWASTSPVAACAFIPKTGYLAASERNGRFGVWETATGKPVWTSRTPTGPAMCVAASPDGKTLATCGSDRTIRLWNVSDGKAGQSLIGHTHTVNGVAFSPDGTRLASASSDNTVRVWDIGSGREVLRMHTRTHYVYAVAFSPDGKRLAEASGEGTVTIYDARTGHESLVLKGHTGAVTRVVFSPDGSRIATTGEDRSVRLWDAPLNIALDIPPGLNDPFDPLGKAKPKQ